MSTMIERVAQAIQQKTCPNDPYDELSEAGKLSHQETARAAIAAMREPTTVMVETAYSKGSGGVRDCWQNMIDEALK